jgi:hypothetical protein
MEAMMTENRNTEIKSIDKRFKFSAKMTWVELTPGFPTPIFRDAHLKVVEPFTQCALAKAEEFQRYGKRGQAFKSAMHALAYALSSLSGFLSSRSLTWRDIDDDVLLKYRDFANEEIRKSGRQKNDLSSMRSVNIKLRQIYHALVWIQEDAKLIDGLIGIENCAVKSSLIRARDGFRGNSEKDESKFPIRYPRVGEGSRQQTDNYWATDEDYDLIEDYFWREFSLPIAERNVLMLAIANQNGLRRASINSLTVDQFANVYGNTNKMSLADALLVKPASQKNQGQHYFKFNYALVSAIQRYIDGARASIVETTGTKSKSLFLAENGKPLTLNSLTRIFSDAFHAIGVTAENAAVHAFRRKFGSDTYSNALASRRREGLPVGAVELAEATSTELGQNSYLSSQSYIKVTSHVSSQTVEAKLKTSLHQAESENIGLRAEVEALRRELSIR